MKLLRILLFPFSLLYGGIIIARNFFYDQGLLKSKNYDIPIICVGNLSTGGTGKSPMVELLIELLEDDYRVAVLSRGYKRKTKGFRNVYLESTAEEAGDEPLQFKQKFPKAIVAVCADRREGIEKLKDKADLILLDDAFQHRKVKASTYILLTPFDDLYINDFMLPSGNLREPAWGAKRADIIVVTKCPNRVAYAKLQEIEYNLKALPHQKVYFSGIRYDEFIYSATETLQIDYLKNKHFTLVTGIANPEPLLTFLEREDLKFDHQKFTDHHHFTSSEIKRLQKEELILTTEKDYMRLKPKLEKFALYYLPINTIILKGQQQFFEETITTAIDAARLG